MEKQSMMAPETPKKVERESESLSDIGEERRGLRGALVIAATAVAILFLGWLLFYFDLYLRRNGGG
jgi:hypothetical protein